jgi:hypothetical protein
LGHGCGLRARARVRARTRVRIRGLPENLQLPRKLEHAVVPADVEVRGRSAIVGTAAAREHLGPLAPAHAVQAVLE